MKKRLLNSWMERLGFNRSSRVASATGRGAGRFVFETLEPRYLMSADAGGLLAYPTLAGTDTLVQPAVIDTPLLNNPSAPLNLSGSAAIAAASTRHEVVIVDMSVNDHEHLVEDLLNRAGENRQLDVYVIDTKQDGIAQISEILTGYQNLDAVHIISHSSDAQLQLGDTLLSSANLNQYAEQIASWSKSLGAQADLLFYGCDLAEHPHGKALVNALSTITGADVAASTDMTGNAVLGGDWALEYTTGAIETAVALNAQTQQNWMGLLALNTSPVLTPAPTGMSLPSVMQNAGPPTGAVGTLVSDLVDLQGGGGRDNVYDPNVAAKTGIAITQNDISKGILYFTTNGGTNWYPVVLTNPSLALLLSADASTRIYYQPYNGATGTVNTALTFHAWDQTTGYNGKPLVNVILNGGTSAFSTGTQVVSITIGNTALTATNLSASETYTEDEKLNLTDIVVSDTNSTNVNVTLTLSDSGAGSLSTKTYHNLASQFSAGVWSASGNISDVNKLLQAIKFTPAQYYNSDFTIAVRVSDGVAPDLTGTKNVTGITVNNAPTATNLDAAEVYTEDTALNLTDIVVSDIDSTNVTASLTLSDKAVGVLSTGTSGSVTSTFSGGVWTASGAIADVNTLLSGLNFTPSLNYNSNFTIATSVSGGGVAQVTGVKNVTGTAVNDAPTATNLNTSEIYTKNTSLNLTDIIVNDVDAASVSVMLTLSDSSAGTISTGRSGAATSTFVSGVWSASGAIADVNALLTSVTFLPALNYNSDFTITTYVSDGAAAPLTGVKLITGVAVNYAPTATNLNTPETYTEDTPLTLTGVVASDVDSTNVDVTLAMSDTAAGTLSTGRSGETISTFANGLWKASGAIADVNTLLASVTYTPTLNYNSNFTITTRVSDGIAAPLTGTKAITGIAVNDAPVIGGTSNISQSIADTASIKPFSTVTVDDVDLPAQQLTVTVTLDAMEKGSLSNLTGFTRGSAGSYSLTGSASEVSAALQGLVFTPNANRVAPDSIETSTFTITVVDGSGGTATGSQSVASVSVNDAPIINAQTFTISDSIANGSIATTLTSADIDSGDTRTYAITGGNATSTFTIDPSTGVVRVIDSSALRTNTASTMTLAVTVTDAHGLSSTADVTVTIITVSKTSTATTQTTPTPTPPVIDTATNPQPASDKSSSDEMNTVGRLLPGGRAQSNAVVSKPKGVAVEATPVAVAETAQANDTSKNPEITMPLVRAPLSLMNAGATALSSLVRNVSFTRELDQIRNETRHDIAFTKVTAGVSIATTTGLSVGYVAWLVRGGALLSSVLSSMPAWRMIDPLPILSYKRQDDAEEDDESLESMVRKGNLEDAPTDEA